jgi:hypothetical protein
MQQQPKPQPLTDAQVIEVFIASRSIAGLRSEDARRARADLLLVRYRPLLGRPTLTRSPLGVWLLEIINAASPAVLTGSDELVLEFVTSAVWQAREHALPLSLLAKAFDWRLAPLQLALGLDAQPTSARAVEVCAWLVAHTRAACADELAIQLLCAPVLQRFLGDLLRGKDLARAQALELIGEVAMRAPSVADALAPICWSALMVDSMNLREQVVAISFDVLFVLLARDALPERAALHPEERGYSSMIRFLPRMLYGPTAALQRIAVAGVARMVLHANADASFDEAVSRATEDECFTDELILQLATRYVDVQQSSHVAAAGSRVAGGPGLSAEEDGDVLADIDHALQRMDEGLLADCAVYVVVRSVKSGEIDHESARGYGPAHAHARRALQEIVRRLTQQELRDGLVESISSNCLEFLQVSLDPDRVQAWLGMPRGVNGR